MAGIDTTAWQTDPALQQNRPDPRGSQAFAANWPNPSSYPGQDVRKPLVSIDSMLYSKYCAAFNIDYRLDNFDSLVKEPICVYPTV